MSPTYAGEFSECPVIIEAEFFADGYLTSFRKPKKLKKLYFFQCVDIGASERTNALGTSHGDFFVIDPELSGETLTLSKGHKLNLTGTTFIQNYFGTEVGVFFIVNSIEIVNK